MDKIFIFLLVLALIILIIISTYIKLYIDGLRKRIICKTNKDCSNGQLCEVDIDRSKRCINKNNMIQRICIKLVVPSFWATPN